METMNDKSDKISPGVAQRGELLTFNQEGAGASPAARTNIGIVGMIERGDHIIHSSMPTREDLRQWMKDLERQRP